MLGKRTEKFDLVDHLANFSNDSDYYASIFHIFLILEPLKLFVSPSDFESLLRHICPSTSGLYQEEVRTETVCSLLSLRLKFNLQTVIDDCKSFLKSQK